MSYSDGQTSDFIPMNLRLGAASTINLDNFNKLSLTLDLNKLLVPTPPIYNSNMEIIDGKDPNVSVPVAIFQSFYDILLPALDSNLKDLQLISRT